MFTDQEIQKFRHSLRNDLNLIRDSIEVLCDEEDDMPINKEEMLGDINTKIHSVEKTITNVFSKLGIKINLSLDQFRSK